MLHLETIGVIMFQAHRQNAQTLLEVQLLITKATVAHACASVTYAFTQTPQCA